MNGKYDVNWTELYGQLAKLEMKLQACTVTNYPETERRMMLGKLMNALLFIAEIQMYLNGEMEGFNGNNDCSRLTTYAR